MGALDVELASLRERLAGKPTNADTLRRRIGEIESAVKSAPAETTDAPVIETPPVMEVETATLKRGPGRPRKS